MKATLRSDEMREERNASPPKGRLPRVGKGRSYACAFHLARCRQRAEVHLPVVLNEALVRFCASISTRQLDSRSFEVTAKTCADLNSRFDMDSIVSFSHAWPAWNDALQGTFAAGLPLDQTLFTGHHAKSKRYHLGIARLARSQRSFVLRACRKLIRERGLRLLDLGSGYGLQARLLLDQGIVQDATCVDHPFVVNSAPKADSRIRWVAGDIRRLDTDHLGPFNLLWLGNVLHHYKVDANVEMVHRYAPLLERRSLIAVQEYVLEGTTRFSLPAAILGVHFALTTEDGRTYSLAEIREILRAALGDARLAGRADGHISSLLVFRTRGGRA